MEDKPEEKLDEKVLEYNLRCNYFQKVGAGEYCCVLIRSHRIVLLTQKCFGPKLSVREGLHQHLPEFYRVPIAN